MPCVREVLEEWMIEIIQRKGLPGELKLPHLFVETEPDIDRTASLWHKFVQAVNRLCANTPRSRHLKRAVFTSGMERLCRDFSQQTENVKVSYIEQESASVEASRRHKPPTANVRHLLRVVQLTPIPDEIRNARGAAAEIPKPPPPPVQATRLTPEAAQNGDNRDENGAWIPSVPAEILDDPETVTTTLPSSSLSGGDDGERAGQVLREQIPAQAAVAVYNDHSSVTYCGAEPLITPTTIGLGEQRIVLDSGNDTTIPEAEVVVQLL